MYVCTIHQRHLRAHNNKDKIQQQQTYNVMKKDQINNEKGQNKMENAKQKR